MPQPHGQTGPIVAAEEGIGTSSRVRKFRSEDADAVIALAAQAPEAANWTNESYVQFANGSESLFLVSESNGEIHGFLVGRLAADQAELLNLAVAPTQRRQGAGTALLTKALEEWRSQGAKSVYLEVRESNTTAIAFYEKYGFAQTGFRKGYYRAPDEAALTMVKKLTASPT